MKRILLVLIVIGFISCKQNNTRVINNTVVQGTVFGTYYRVTYYSNKDYQKEFDSLFNIINNSLSTYLENSDISKVNRNELTEIDNHFKNVFQASKVIYHETNGAFDPTIGNVVNAWNFGAEQNKFLTDSITIDSLMQFVGFNKINLSNNSIIKPKTSYLEFNAIAKGYAVDVISQFLSDKRIDNHLVDIGGELMAKGINAQKNKEWLVGIENPNFDGTQSTNKVVKLQDEAMATSGTYRKFKIDENGNRYAHIIDTESGYPSKTNLLSISVIARDCMTADAYATAFKTMGIEKVKTFLRAHPELKVFLIFENENNGLETLALNGFPE
ncbi:thiamine biosynthesis lipoprotein [Hyunsoonleella jejuensis]|uniref:FAD:protein FMN transferase n=1 Tax=Hyunsoonleella jejuensis TaxID=419940 RepID=A0A1H9D1G1_9FLAO|nr:FAD:protein FMN transferase [Hyunsoonleella jejuensis]SEQ07217.1 thiamine biosynthesis lipoprotein [Hyunsoonleella jejuensis]